MMTRLIAISTANIHALFTDLPDSKNTVAQGRLSKRIRGMMLSLSPLLLCTSMAQASPKIPLPNTLPSAKGASISIASPTKGSVVPASFELVFQSRRMTIMPAGIAHTESGHYHLVIDEDAQAISGVPLKHTNEIAFEKGERSGNITLTPGQHSLQLILVDHLHRPHSPPVVSDKISVTVVAPILVPQSDSKKHTK